LFLETGLDGTGIGRISSFALLLISVLLFGRFKSISQDRPRVCI
jgi:hypothetical protein